MKSVLLGVALLFSASAAQAEIPEGSYSGMVSEFANSSHPSYCEADDVQIDIYQDRRGYDIRWTERGRRKGDWSYCDRYLDVELKPIAGKKDEWRVRFRWLNDLYAGRAWFKGNHLNIRAQISGTNGGRFEARWKFKKDDSRLEYERTVDFFGQLPLRAWGTLNRD